MIKGKYNVASIDVGSNSINLLLANFDNGKIREEITYSYITELGRGLRETNFFSQEGMEKAEEAFKEISSILTKFSIGQEAVICIATEASRVASNALDFYKNIEKNYRIKADIISADDEARFSAIGVVGGDKNETTLIDLGGASTEVMLVKNNIIKKFKSFQIGAVDKASSFNEAEVVAFLRNGLMDKKVILVGGTSVTLAISMLRLKTFDVEKIELSSFTMPEIAAFSTKLGEMSDDEVLKKFPFAEKRLGSFRDGVQRICWFLGEMNPSEIRFSTKGARHGALFDLLGNIKA